MSKPIVFILGPSGSGKSMLATWAAEDLQFLHIEIDRYPDDGIDLAGLRKEWDAFRNSDGQSTDLASVICKRVEDAEKEGVILSFPSNLVLLPSMMDAAESQGVRFLILLGTEIECLDAFLRRERQTGRGLDANHWFKNNASEYAQISCPKYSKYRLMVFAQSGHRNRGDLVAEVKSRVLR